MDYCPIRVSTLRGDLAIPFNVYVRIAGRFILMCRSGDTFEGDRLARLRSKKLKKMFISDDDESSYKGYMTESIENAYANTRGTNIETRAEVIQGAQQAASEDLMEDLESEALYEVAKLGAKKYMDFILNEKEALKTVISIENIEGSVAHHGVAVASLSVAMAKRLELLEDSDEVASQLILGCMLHDFDHAHTGFDINQKTVELAGDALVSYRNHPKRGVERLQGLEHFDPLVLKIVSQHEEYINGEGFPDGLLEREIHPLSLVVSTANTYDRYMSLEKMGRKDALKEMLISKMGQHPLGHMKALQSILKENAII